MSGFSELWVYRSPRASDPSGRCRCHPEATRRYRGKISGPLLERIDLHVEVPRLPPAELRPDAPPCESSDVVRARVIHAPEVQRQRAGRCNAILINRKRMRCVGLRRMIRRCWRVQSIFYSSRRVRCIGFCGWLGRLLILLAVPIFLDRMWLRRLGIGGVSGWCRRGWGERVRAFTRSTFRWHLHASKVFRATSVL